VEPVDVVIVAYHSGEVLDRSIAAAKRLGGRVVVVDHGDGHDARRARAHGLMAVENPGNPGFGAGQNHGLSYSDSRFAVLCNPDATLVADAIQTGIALLQHHGDVAAVQGSIVNNHTGQPERSHGRELGPVHLMGRAMGARRLLAYPWVRRAARRSAVLRDHVERIPTEATDVESLAATVLLVRRSAFDSVGGFDPSYFLYGEDLDLCRRWRARGWRLVAVPDVWAVHVGGASSATSWDRELHWWRGTLCFAARWWDSRRWAVALIAAAVCAGRLTARRPRRALEVWRAFRGSTRARRSEWRWRRIEGPVVVVS
jgi:GT2 family glycosyltransferase